MEGNEQFLQKICIMVECHAYLCGKVKKQKFHYWGAANPNNNLIEETIRSVLKVSVSVAIV